MSGENRDVKKKVEVPAAGKYIIYSDGSIDLFVRDIVHKDQAQLAKKIPENAGFYYVGLNPDNEITCTGSGSDSLGIKDNEDEDQKKLTEYWARLKQKYTINLVKR